MKRLTLILLLRAAAAIPVAASELTPPESAGGSRMLQQVDCSGRSDVVPQANCVVRSGGLLTVWFGYTNCNAEAREISIGESNRFFPGAKDRGQPTAFKPGTWERVFSVTLEHPFIVWILDQTNEVTRAEQLATCRDNGGNATTGD